MVPVTIKRVYSRTTDMYKYIMHGVLKYGSNIMLHETDGTILGKYRIIEIAFMPRASNIIITFWKLPRDAIVEDLSDIKRRLIDMIKKSKEYGENHHEQ